MVLGRSNTGVLPHLYPPDFTSPNERRSANEHVWDGVVVAMVKIAHGVIAMIGTNRLVMLSWSVLPFFVCLGHEKHHRKVSPSTTDEIGSQHRPCSRYRAVFSSLISEYVPTCLEMLQPTRMSDKNVCDDVRSISDCMRSAPCQLRVWFAELTDRQASALTVGMGRRQWQQQSLSINKRS